MPDFRLNQNFPARANARGKAAASAAEPEKVSIWKREIEFSKPFGGKEKQAFFHLLAVLLESGLSITESLEVIIGQQQKKKNKQIIQTVHRALSEGMALSEAVALQPKYFSTFEIQSIRMGERAGQMVRILQDLATYHEKRQKLRRKFVQAFSYPLIVILIAGGVLFFMINYVVPMFSDIFIRFDADLPAITEFVIGLSQFTTEWGLYMLLGLVGLVIAVNRLKNTTFFRKYSSALLLRLPVIGPIAKKIQLSRYCYTLSLMLRSRVNLDQALELMEQIVTFYPLQVTIPAIRKDVVEGKTMYDAVTQHAIYPPMMTQMVRVGEKTARLDAMLDNLGRNLEEEAEGGITTLTNLLEPLLIVILGLMVGIILISMYLPMFELSNTISA